MTEFPREVVHSGAPQPDRPRVDVLHALRLVLKYRWLLVSVPLAVASVVVVAALIVPRRYTARAAFMPHEPKSMAGGLSGVAAQFGLSLPSSDGTTSPEFYADLITSRPMLIDLAEAQYTVALHEAPVTLTEWYGIDLADSAIRIERAAKTLSDNLRVNVVRRSGVVAMAVKDRAPKVGQAILSHALVLLNEYNLQTRQSQASEERRFVEARLASARSELDSAENRVETFLTRNRNFRNSPQLTFEYERLDRQAQMASQVYTSLAQAYEQARIEEVRNTPVITVVEQPYVNALPDSRHLGAKFLISIALGSLLAMGLSTLVELVKATKTHDPGGYQEVEELRHEAIRDVRALVGRVTSAVRKGSPSHHAD